MKVRKEKKNLSEKKEVEKAERMRLFNFKIKYNAKELGHK